MTDTAAGAAVLGVASHGSWGDVRRSLPELIFGVVSDALTDAGCTMSDIDGVVIAGHDLVDGRSLSSMITGPAAGAYLRDEIRVSDDGLVALLLGAARVHAGEATRVVVASWGRPTEGDPERTSRVAYEPFSEQPLGLATSTVGALRASAYLRRHPAAAREAAVAARTARAAANPRRVDAAVESGVVFPLRPGEVGRATDVAAAVVLGMGSGPRITGIGQGTEPARLGDRSLHCVEGARAAAAAAMLEAGVTAADVGVVEVAGSTVFEEAMLLEAAGVADAGGGLDLIATEPWVNPSGGSAAGQCYPCDGLLRFVEAVRQIRGDACRIQLEPRPTTGLVLAGAAVASQTSVAVVIEGS